MKTKLSPGNPFGYSRYGFAYEFINDGAKCLDYGCYDGKFINKVVKSKNVDFVGVDKNIEIINKNPFGLKLLHITNNNELPFENETFDYISILDVIEHIYDQRQILKEINRILKTDGVLIITVPQKHLFSFLDLGNYKFIFPNIHRMFYTLNHSKKDYEKKYLHNPDGLIGDIEIEKSWHQHFSKKELKELLNECGFSVLSFDGSGFFTRVFNILRLVGLNFIIPRKVIDFDYKKFHSTNLFCAAIKKVYNNE